MAPDEATARSLPRSGTAGADWAAMQKAAQAAGGSATELDDATEAEFPSAELAKAVFAAAPDAVTAADQDRAWAGRWCA